MKYLIIANNIVTLTGKKLSARLVYENYMHASCWDYSPSAPLYWKMVEGDEIVFYLAGFKERNFVGTAQVISKPFEKKPNDPEVFATSEMPFFSYRILLGNINIWKTHKPLHDFFNKLSFLNLNVIPRQQIGLMFRAGIRLLSEEDFSTIINFQ